ncbi:MAG TPA: prepilin-type N-terminal cleavage/methylation domain-containing protein [Sumerlaeia bacterium]|nr:prepilin-type N-terminal cleavage/methylation domain-containing protein [Sumerlaeia bacterium]
MRRSRGFTLVEVIIVALVLGIVALLALPAMESALAEARLFAALNEIVAALEFAQLSAMGSGRPCRVTIDAAADTMLVEQVECGADFMDPSQTQLAEADVESETYTTMERPLKRGAPYRIAFAGEGRFEGVDVAAAAFGGGNFVVFDALGSPSEGGTVALTLGDWQAGLTLHPVSGKIVRSDG